MAEPFFNHYYSVHIWKAIKFDHFNAIVQFSCCFGRTTN